MFYTSIVNKSNSTRIYIEPSIVNLDVSDVPKRD